MSDFNPLPVHHQAQALGQLLHATLEGRSDVALSTGATPAPPSWAQLAQLRATANKAQPSRADVALSASKDADMDAYLDDLFKDFN